MMVLRVIICKNIPKNFADFLLNNFNNNIPNIKYVITWLKIQQML